MECSGLFRASGSASLLFLIDCIVRPSDRLGRGSILITSQFPVSQWHQLIGDATVADALLDRLVHQAYRIELKGESMRKTRAGQQNTKPSPVQRKIIQSCGATPNQA